MSKTKSLISFFLALAIVHLACQQAHCGEQISSEALFVDLAGKSGAIAAQSVFRIGYAGRERGTGFFHKSGNILTADHVVRDCDVKYIEVLVPWGKKLRVAVSKLAPIPQKIETDLEWLSKQEIGLVTTRKYSDGTEEKISQSKIIAEVLQYLRSQTQLVIGHAVMTNVVRLFLERNGIEP